ncbi:hypothetical protein H0H93_010625, partial [Arthromyces matolae]
MRQICKYMYSATQERTVWYKALQNTCYDNGLFLPSFSMATMTLKYLEHSALAPMRFLALINDHETQKFQELKPMKIRILEPRVDRVTANRVREVFKKIFLVPGGRFLMTQSQQRICVWDIGTHALDEMKSRALASHSGVWLELLECLPMANGRDLLVLTGTKDPLNQHTRYTKLSIHKIRVEDEVPCFTPVATFKKEAPIELKNFCFKEKMLILRCFQVGDVVPEELLFWDFNANQIGRLFHHIEDPTSVLQIGDDEVLLFDRCGMSLYNFPRDFYEYQKGFTSFFGDDDATNRTAVDSAMDFAHPPPRPYEKPEVTSTNWLPAHLDLGYFTIMARSAAGIIVQDIYAISQVDHEDLPARMPSLRSTYPPQSTYCSSNYERGFTEMHFCEGYITRTWRRADNSDDDDMEGIIILTAEINDRAVAKGGGTSPDGMIRRLWKPSFAD